ncbi:sugar ABC transporter ATP-binding protein [bacterium LRH843]|nr:sugar ABC transporter ATP-binding protein [bacterium LRH843]
MNKFSEDQTILYTKNIGKQFSGVTVLRDINLSIQKGEVHTLLGANGAGKSTLIKIIDGIHTEYEGEFYIRGKLAKPANTDESRKLGVGMVHQELSLVPELSVAENIFLGRLPRNSVGFVNKGKLIKESKVILDELEMNISPHQLVEDLSIADQQMIEIAKVLSQNVDIILLDEPTSALSDTEVNRLFETIRRLKKQGKAIIFITHKFEEIYAISDRLSVLRDGMLIETLDLQAEKEDLDKKLISLMTGTDEDELTELYPEKSATADETILEVRNFSSRGKFQDISFALKRGEILGLAGLKGAGRTELARAIFGADPKDSGQLFLQGEEVKIKSPIQAIKRGIGLISEDRKKEGFVGTLGVKENINLTTIADTVKGLLISEKLERSKAKKYISMLNVKTSSEDTLIINLSGGNQQKVVLAKWLAADGKVLIFDEPTRGVDVNAKSEIYKIMRTLADQGVGVLFISSEFPELIGLSNRCLVVNEGKIVKELVADDVTKENIMNSIFEDKREGVHK